MNLAATGTMSPRRTSGMRAVDDDSGSRAQHYSAAQARPRGAQCAYAPLYGCTWGLKSGRTRESIGQLFNCLTPSIRTNPHMGPDAELFLSKRCPFLAVRPEGAKHLWRRIPPGELSIGPEADERPGWATGWAGAS